MPGVPFTLQTHKVVNRLGETGLSYRCLCFDTLDLMPHQVKPVLVGLTVSQQIALVNQLAIDSSRSVWMKMAYPLRLTLSKDPVSAISLNSWV